MSAEPVFSSLDVGGARLRTARWGDGPAGIVLLHDGLGSITQWRSMPAQLAARTSRTVVAYERAGHGKSVPIPNGPWPADWLHREATVLTEVIAQVATERPLVVGHSDGGSIALIHAATEAGPVAGVVSLAAHSWVEQVGFDSIVAMRTDRERIIRGLSRHHDAPEAIFEAWSGVWVSDAFRRWDIRPLLAAVEVPVLVAQGRVDDYATESHVSETVRAIGPNATGQIVDGVGHIMHHDDPSLVVDLIAEFISQ